MKLGFPEEVFFEKTGKRQEKYGLYFLKSETDAHESIGAEDGSRTRTAFATRPSNVRVYHSTTSAHDTRTRTAF